MPLTPRRLLPAIAGLILVSISLLTSAGAQPAGENGKPSPSAPEAIQHEVTHEAASHADLAAMAANLPLWTVLPFAALLASIAVFPLAANHWWEHNGNKAIVVAVLTVPITLYLLYTYGAVAQHGLVEKVTEYLSFIILLAALYIISGGIHIGGSLSGTPLANTGLLALGALIASVIGTTGASVLLIRPLLRANESRRSKAHIVVFFIFIVSNCGGLLTPLGDPPLFMGFLKGVPFEWTLVNLWPQWVVVNAALLALFNIWDQLVFDKEEKDRPGSQLEEVMEHQRLSVEGMLNFAFLAGIVTTIFCAGQGYLFSRDGKGYQEAIMVGLAVLAYVTTPAANRVRNKFTFGPIIEVAVLFIGIFITMAPALHILNAWGSNARPDLGPLTIRQSWQFFWATGILSSILDNAPTYMTMAATACGLEGVAVGENPYLREFLAKGPEAAKLLAAISCGAVFMGANTYIGNGPNFMVKAIAEENGVKMPSFFGYMLYSGCVLIPIFIGVTIVFFRR